jgi:Cd2+/Zn2+-exporting ATPase
MKLADISLTFNNKDIEVLENSDIVINNQDINNIIKTINMSYKTKEIIFINTIVTIVIKVISSILSLCGLLSLSIIMIIEILVLLIIIINTLVTQKRD